MPRFSFPAFLVAPVAFTNSKTVSFSVSYPLIVSQQTIKKFVNAMLDHVALWNTQASDELPAFMNGPVKNALGIIPPEVTWRTCKLSIELSLMFYQMFIYAI